MFMVAPPTAVEQSNLPDPHADRSVVGADAPTNPRHLLTLVRALIEFGRQLAATLQQHAGGAEVTAIARNFGTVDIAQIIACITRGLHRAAALEARLLRRLAREPEAPAATSATGAASARRPRAARSVQPSDSPADPHLARLPTPADIAEQVRRRPIGAVIADICRDFGIVPNDRLWRDLALPIIVNGGNLAKLLKDTLQRIFAWVTDPPDTDYPVRPPQQRPFTLASNTGPP